MIINVCIGSACHLKGSYEIINRLNAIIKETDMEKDLTVKASFCLGNCMGAVSVKFDNQIYSVQPDTVEQFFNKEVRERVRE